MVNTTVQLRLVTSFEDPTLSKELWDDLLRQGSSEVVFLTWHWQKVWWEVFGRGKLLIIIAEQEGKPIAMAPLFADQGMIYWVGSGGSDYLDFIGDIRDPDVLESMLLLAAEQTPGFLGFCFYHVLDTSATAQVLKKVASRLNWVCYDEGQMAAPLLDFKNFPEESSLIVNKKRLHKYESYFRLTGDFHVDHFHRRQEILSALPSFIQQHITRWEVTEYPSLFLDPKQKLFYQRLAECADESGWLRLTRINWQDQAIAYHFGFCHQGSFVYYKPSYDIGLSSRSPGQVLLRHVLLRAQDEGCSIFDFGLGEEAYKNRFSTGTRYVNTWGLYPPTSLKKEKI